MISIVSATASLNPHCAKLPAIPESSEHMGVTAALAIASTVSIAVIMLCFTASIIPFLPRSVGTCSPRARRCGALPSDSRYARQRPEPDWRTGARLWDRCDFDDREHRARAEVRASKSRRGCPQTADRASRSGAGLQNGDNKRAPRLKSTPHVDHAGK